MENVRTFKLKNKGGFVARMEIIYGGNEGADEHGNVMKFAEGTWKPSGYRDICVSDEGTIDLADTGIPQGAEVKLKAVVRGGKDKTSGSYIYRNEGDIVRSFKIKGTTLYNSLEKA